MTAHGAAAGVAHRAADERGIAATIVLLPIFAAATFMLVQAVFWQNDRQVAANAADRASAAVALHGARVGDAEADAVAQLASAGLSDISVSITRGPATTTVQISARAPGLLTGMSVTVSATSVTPSEGYRAP